MARLILTTCGTSLLTNKVGGDFRSLLFHYSNDKEVEISNNDLHIIKEHIEKRKQALLSETSADNIKDMSAELNGLLT